MEEGGAAPRILNLGGETVDTKSATGKLILTIFAGFAQFEREMMLERQREGIAKAQKEGRYKGRPKSASLLASEARQMVADGKDRDRSRQGARYRPGKRVPGVGGRGGSRRPSRIGRGFQRSARTNDAVQEPKKKIDHFAIDQHRPAPRLDHCEAARLGDRRRRQTPGRRCRVGLLRPTSFVSGSG